MILVPAVTIAPTLARRLVPAALRLLAGTMLFLAGLGAGVVFLVGAIATNRMGFLAASFLSLGGAVPMGLLLASTALGRHSRSRPPDESTSRASGAPTSGYREYGVAIAVLGAIVGIGVVRAGARSFFVGDRLQPMKLAWYPLLVLLMLPVLIAAHELGHAAAARFSGVRFESLLVGPVELRRDSGRWRVVWRSVVPEDVSGAFMGRWDDWAQSWGSIVAISVAGPLASAAAACACAAAALALGEGRTPGTAIAVDALWVATCVGSIDAIGNLVPGRTEKGGLLNDGARLALAFRFGRRAGHLMVRFLAARQRGRRPRNFGLDAAECLAASDAMPGSGQWLLLAALYVANDRGDTALAREVLARARGDTDARPAAPRARAGAGTRRHAQRRSGHRARPPLALPARSVLCRA